LLLILDYFLIALTRALIFLIVRSVNALIMHILSVYIFHAGANQQLYGRLRPMAEHVDAERGLCVLVAL